MFQHRLKSRRKLTRSIGWSTSAFILLALVAAGCQPVASVADAKLSDGNALDVSLEVAADNRILIRFTNVSKVPLRILKPLDGSEHSWTMPYYAFHLDDGQGTKFQMIPRCGHFGSPYGETKWPDDYLVEILPGKSHVEEMSLYFIIPQDGEYTVSFQYDFTPTSTRLPDDKHIYPAGLWRGKAAARPIQLKLKATPISVG